MKPFDRTIRPAGNHGKIRVRLYSTDGITVVRLVYSGSQLVYRFEWSAARYTEVYGK